MFKRVAIFLVLMNPFSYAQLSATFEASQLYHPYKEMSYSPRDVGLPFEEVHLNTADGMTLHGWWIPAVPQADQGTRLALLYCHGNGGNISHRLDKAVGLHRMGFDLLLFDYRGYGRSNGTPSENGTYEDARTFYEYLRLTKGYADSEIVLYGESLGGAVAVETALHHPVRGVILESTFTSTVEMARIRFPQLPVDRLIRYRYDSLSKIGRVTCPILVMHSRQDGTVPYAMGRQLFEAANQPKSFVELSGSHVMGYQQSGREYAEGLNRFLKLLRTRPTPEPAG